VRNEAARSRKAAKKEYSFAMAPTTKGAIAEKPRPTLYKKAADRFMAEIKKLMVREKEVRAEIDAGRIESSDPRWLANRPVNKLYAREGRINAV